MAKITNNLLRHADFTIGASQSQQTLAGFALHLTGRRTSARVDLTGESVTKINEYGGPHGFTGKREIYAPSPHFLGLQVVAVGFLFPCPDIPDIPVTISQNRLSKRDNPTLVRA